LDNLNFSDQFYFMGTITICGIFSLTIGLSAIIRNEYIFFSDPVIYPMILFFAVFLGPMKLIFRKIFNKMDYWKVKQEKVK
jgi:O-antigen/teichoic acid export membrane protein